MKTRISTAPLLGAFILAFSLPAFAAEGEKPAVKAAAQPYTLEVCIVSDEKLGEMGKPFVFVHEGQEVKLCCKSCKEDFDKDPVKYLKKLEKK